MSRRLPLALEVPAVLPLAQAPELPFQGLDTLWLQLTGTLCNIACRHCFITCGPLEDRVPMMTRQRVDELLVEARALGVKEYYLTGGEPMLHPAFFEIVGQILEQGPVSVLTNAILIDAAAASALRRLFDAARYSLDLRVSIDGMTPEENDPVRGRGTFAQTMAGISALAQAGLSPVLTVVEHRAGLGSAEARARFLSFARSLGLSRPRVKFLPLLHIGREERRTRPYEGHERVEDLPPELAAALQCGSSRLATQDHILTCPLLLDAPEARMGRTLAGALRPIHLRWAACHTCVVEGLSCRT